jgi:hypothetical protein
MSARVDFTSQAFFRDERLRGIVRTFRTSPSALVSQIMSQSGAGPFARAKGPATIETDPAYCTGANGTTGCARCVRTVASAVALLAAPKTKPRTAPPFQCTARQAPSSMCRV